MVGKLFIVRKCDLEHAVGKLKEFGGPNGHRRLPLVLRISEGFVPGQMCACKGVGGCEGCGGDADRARVDVIAGVGFEPAIEAPFPPVFRNAFSSFLQKAAPSDAYHRNMLVGACRKLGRRLQDFVPHSFAAAYTISPTGSGSIVSQIVCEAVGRDRVVHSSMGLLCEGECVGGGGAG